MSDDDWGEIDDGTIEQGEAILSGSPSINVRKVLTDILAGLEGTPLPPGFARVVVEDIQFSGEGLNKGNRSRMVAMVMQGLLKLSDAAPVEDGDMASLQDQLDRLKTEMKDEMKRESDRAVR